MILSLSSIILRIQRQISVKKNSRRPHKTVDVLDDFVKYQKNRRVQKRYLASIGPPVFKMLFGKSKTFKAFWSSEDFSLNNSEIIKTVSSKERSKIVIGWTKPVNLPHLAVPNLCNSRLTFFRLGHRRGWLGKNLKCSSQFGLIMKLTYSLNQDFCK